MIDGWKWLYYANTLDTIEATILQKKKMKQDVDQVDLYAIIKLKKKKRTIKLIVLYFIYK
jgi:hypothetical protein